MDVHNAPRKSTVEAQKGNPEQSVQKAGPSQGAAKASAKASSNQALQKTLQASTSGTSPQRATLLQQEKRLLDAAINADEITSQVRISEYCTKLIPLVKVLLQIGYKTYRQMPLPKAEKIMFLTL